MKKDSQSPAKTVVTEMSSQPIVVSPDTPVSRASALMGEAKIRHLPVVEGGIVVGVISDRDLQQATMLADAMTVLVGDFMVPHPYCVSTGTPLIEVVRTMGTRKYGCAIVTSLDGDVIGIFTTIDGMRILGELLEGGGSSEPHKGIENFLSGSYLI